MPSRIDGLNEPQNPLDNKGSSNAKKQLWHGRDIQQQLQPDQNDLSPELQISIPSNLENKIIPQPQEESSKKRTRKTGESFEASSETNIEGELEAGPSSKRARKGVYKTQVVKEKVLPVDKNERAEQPQTPERNQKHEEKIFFQNKISSLEAEYHEQQQSLLSLSKRAYFEAAKDEHVISVVTQDEYKKIDSELGWSRLGLQLITTEQKISEYCSHQPKKVQELFQPILKTLERSKKCFLTHDLLYKIHDKKTHPQLLEEIVLSMEQAVLNVPIGQSTLIPAGYSIHEAGGGRGHTVYLVFTKTSETKFKLEVYNTGDGIDFHLSSETTPKKYYPKVYLEIDSSKLTKDFFSKIVHLMDLNEGEESDDIVASLIYLTIERELKVIEDPESTRKEKPYQDQGLVSRCTYSPLSRYVHNSLKDHEEVYARYKLYTTTTLITQYSKQLNQEISSGSIDKIQILSKDLFEKLLILGEEVLEDRKEKIEWISNSKRADPQFMLKQVQKNGRSLRFGSEEIRKNMIIAKAAIQNDPKAIYYVPPDLQKDPKFVEFISNINS